MLRIDRGEKSLTLLDEIPLAEAAVSERYDLQEFICNDPKQFFKEIGQELFLIGDEIVPSKTVQDRIDILAVDKEGACVIVELKRGSHKLQMLQAISYAGMISDWGPEDIFALLDDDEGESLVDFLEVDRDDINRRQRIILIAEAYDYALLIGAEWLCEQYGVDVTCCRIALAKDETSSAEYMVCSNVYPAPELAKEAVPRRKGRTTGSRKWADWEGALSGIKNDALVDYFERELAEDREAYLLKRILRYRLSGKRRWFVAARTDRAYVWQQGRFDGDVEFWRQGLNQPDDVKEVKSGACLRFFLRAEEDFDFFHSSATQTLKNKAWAANPSEKEVDEEEIED